MTAFNKDDFSYSSGWLTYGKDYKFVARFKHRGFITKAKFIKQLIKNHTVEEYFSKLDGGDTPLGILRDADWGWYETEKEKFIAKHK